MKVKDTKKETKQFKTLGAPIPEFINEGLGWGYQEFRSTVHKSEFMSADDAKK